MMETPHALIKDLLSTGYFFEELKTYTDSKEIDLPSFSRNFAVPYLVRKSESYDRLGQSSRANILSFAAKFLQEADDGDMAETIFGLKRVVTSEMDINEKALHRNDQLAKPEILSCRRKLETAQSLAKMLVSIIRVFHLGEIVTKRDKADGSCGSVCDAIKDYWKLSAPPIG